VLSLWIVSWFYIYVNIDALLLVEHGWFLVQMPIPNILFVWLLAYLWNFQGFKLNYCLFGHVNVDFLVMNE
jgi:hypothetical protein